MHYIERHTSDSQYTDTQKRYMCIYTCLDLLLSSRLLNKVQNSVGLQTPAQRELWDHASGATQVILGCQPKYEIFTQKNILLPLHDALGQFGCFGFHRNTFR
jgi:hypothetical protein